MYKLASLALAASLGVAALAHSAPAAADGRFVIEGPRIVVGLPLPYAAGYYGPYYYEHGRYWHRDYDHERYERERYWRHDYDRDRYEHYRHDGDRR